MAYSKNRTLAQRFAFEDSQRMTVLDRVRECSSLTKPWILPPIGQTDQTVLPETFQSIGSRGVTSLESDGVLEVFPLDSPWFVLRASPEVRYSPRANPAAVAEMDEILYRQSLLAIAILESSNMKTSDDRSGRAGFRTAKRMSFGQIVVTGETLEQLTDDYRIKVFRRDAYTTRRDPCGDVLGHTICEKKDPCELTDQELEKAGLKPRQEYEETPPHERMMNLITAVDWQPQTKKWVIKQEINDHELNESEEKVSPFFCTPYELVPGENYGRGFVEINLGDLRCLDEMERRRIDLIGLLSTGLVAIDGLSTTKESDLMKRPGSVIRARVQGGVVQDVGMVTFNTMREVQMLTEAINAKTTQLGRAMLLDADSVRQSERTTAYEVESTVINRRVSALSGFFAPITDAQQVPLAQRLLFQMKRDRLMLPIPGDAVEVKILTGLAALTMQQRLGRVMGLAQFLKELPPEAQMKIDYGVLVDVVTRYSINDEIPGLVKTNAQVRAEQQQQLDMEMRQQSQIAANQQTASTAGKVVESNLDSAA